MHLSEQTQLEAAIGFLIGTLIGVLGSWAFIMFFTDWGWYFKLTSSIGELGIIGTLVLSLKQSILARKNYIEVQKEMAKMNAESNNKLGEQNGEPKKESPL